MGAIRQEQDVRWVSAAQWGSTVDGVWVETLEQIAVSSWSGSRVGRQKYAGRAAGCCLSQARGFGRETAVANGFGSETCDVGVRVEIAAEH